VGRVLEQVHMIEEGDGTFAKRIRDGKCPKCKTGFSFVHSHDQGEYWECPTCKLKMNVEDLKS
jgi:ribosomal protein L37AE/L43A